MGYFSHHFVWLPSKLLKIIGRGDQERKKLIMVCADDGWKETKTRRDTKKTQPNYGILIIVGRECFVYITVQEWHSVYLLQPIL